MCLFRSAEKGLTGMKCEKTFEVYIEDSVENVSGIFEEEETSETISSEISAADREENADVFSNIWVGIDIAVVILLIALLVFLRIMRKKVRSKNSEEGVLDMTSTIVPDKKASSYTGTVQIGKVHNIGKRNQQQDSLGVTDTAEGVFAVVADGMGGLSNGDKVSQTVVMTMLQDIAHQANNSGTQRLFEMVSHANDTINRMLGVQSQYVSGSTVIAVLTGRDSFEWVSVGDSRICLYRGGRLIQLNREHNYESELLWQAVNGEISFQEIQENPKRRGLTSFIGMGKLKYVDGSCHPVSVAAGDWVLLMSDGIFNTLSDQEICDILENCQEPQQAAAEMEERILKYQRPKQDNFTAVILRFS